LPITVAALVTVITFSANIQIRQAHAQSSIVGNYAAGYEQGKEDGKNAYRGGSSYDASCPREFSTNMSFCTGYHVGYAAGWGAAKVLGGK